MKHEISIIEAYNKSIQENQRLMARLDIAINKLKDIVASGDCESCNGFGIAKEALELLGVKSES